MTRLAIIFSLLFVTPAWAEWRFIDSSVDGVELYLDIDKVRASNGYVYYWNLMNRSEPSNGAMSLKEYHKGDCDSLGIKKLQITSYLQPMGVEELKTDSYDPEWFYLDPDSIGGTLLQVACLVAESKK